MNRLSMLCLLIGLVACICLAPPSAAATTSQAPADQYVLTPDVFLSMATVTTIVEEAFPCPCTISSGCPYSGFDCADPAGCCHCAGPDPSHLKCVANVH